jgi:hypothetical protein
MFVICNAIDQTDLKKPVAERMSEGMGHAGPSITITSFTNAVAFFIGAQTKIIALRMFCMFAGFAIIMLYYGCLTVFAATLAFDMRR